MKRETRGGEEEKTNSNERTFFFDKTYGEDSRNNARK